MLLNQLNNLVIKILVPILTKLNSIFFLALLFRLNLRKINSINPKQKTKYRIIVLGKLGGNEDLYRSQKENNKYVAYYYFPRIFVKMIFNSIVQNHKEIHDYKYLTNNKNVNVSKLKLRKFLVILLKNIRKNFDFDGFISFNFCYKAERELQAAATIEKLKFICLHKENVYTPGENLVSKYIYKKHLGKFEGYTIAVYSEKEKKDILDAKLIDKKRIKVIGCARSDQAFSYRNIIPSYKIVYYSIENGRGTPERFFKIYPDKFRNIFNFSGKKFSNFSWDEIHNKTIKNLIKLASEDKKLRIIIKEKQGAYNNYKDLKLPSNCTLIFGGTGEKFLKDCKVVIGLNTTAILEAIAANRYILIPFYKHKNDNYKKNFLLNLRLSQNNYVFEEREFYKKIKFHLSKKYKLNKNNNNQFSLNYYLGNIDGKSSKRLNEFIINSLKSKI